jgi:regulator of protease activity HflC (stomatin/prohibitin superfamily)
MEGKKTTTSTERDIRVQNGWVMLVFLIGLLLGDIWLLIFSIVDGVKSTGAPHIELLILSALLLPLCIILMTGFFTLQPNEARVLVLFGAYKGTVRTSGFHWGNPFYSNGPVQFRTLQERVAAAKAAATAPAPMQKTLGRNKISLRARNFNGEKLKVNDKRGNPVEIAAVVVWRIEDSAQAMFDVDNYENYVRVQSESALRHLASRYAYDHGEDSEEDNEITLRSNVEEVSQALCAELQERLAKAGVRVDEARLTHLAYAPEIAQAMLRRQQAEAVIAARKKIVFGAVSMVDMALKELAAKQVVQLDDERRASMVSNLMVVLCGESEVHPIVNTGTLYT